MVKILFHIFVVCSAVIVISGNVFAEEQKAGRVEIIAVPTSESGTMWLLEPKIKKLKEPLKFHWYFGDGEESSEKAPPPHYYEYGKCNVVLEVRDGDGRIYTASTTIDVEAG
jgi:hypothetical protein